MRILITNDDGINAEGLEVLRRSAARFSDDVWVVAPETNQSGVSHALTLAQPLRVREIDNHVYAVSGTPTDCVIVAVRQLMDSPPDLILSGVNAGQNAADHITYSGTVAGALEGAILGVPSIALSQAHDWSKGVDPVDWTVSLEKTPEILEKLIGIELPTNSFLNVNFPIKLTSDEDQVMISRQARRMHGLNISDRVDGVGRPYYWLKFEDGEHEECGTTDLAALSHGKISITPVKVDMTDHEMRSRLEEVFEV